MKRNTKDSADILTSCPQCAGRGVVSFKCVGTKQGRRGRRCPHCDGRGEVLTPAK